MTRVLAAVVFIAAAHAQPAVVNVPSGGTNGGLYRDSSGNIQATATGGTGPLCYVSVSGAVPAFTTCPSGGSGAPLTNPSGGQNNYAPSASPTFMGTITGVGVVAGPAVPGGRLSISYTAVDHDQAETIQPTPSYYGSLGVNTMSSVYATQNFGATGGSSIHVLSYVSQNNDSSSGAGVAPQLAAGYFSTFHKSGSSTGGSYVDYEAAGFNITGGAAAVWAGFDVGAAPNGSGLSNAYGLKIPNSWNSASGDNCGVCIGGTGFVPAGVWTPLGIAGGTSIFGGPISFNNQGAGASSGVSSLIKFGTNYQTVATNGEFALITGTASAFSGNTTVNLIAGIDIGAGNDQGSSTGVVTSVIGARVGVFDNNAGYIGTQIVYDGTWGIGGGGHVTGNTYGFKLEDIVDNSVSNHYDGNIYGIYMGKVAPTTAVLGGTAYSAYFSDASAEVYVAGPLVNYAQKATTGQRYVCIDTTGKLVSSATPCSGT